jgi:hypothetical protein
MVSPKYLCNAFLLILTPVTMLTADADPCIISTPPVFKPTENHGSENPRNLWLFTTVAVAVFPFASDMNRGRGQQNVDLYIHSPIRLHGVMLN